MDFALDPALASLRGEVRAFVDERVIPAERQVIEEDLSGGRRDTLRRLQAEAKAAGLWTPHLPPEWGGRGLGVLGMCALFREMGRSPVGAKVCNCDAPNQGNMDMLLAVASDAIKDRWLRPLCDGTITSAFAMTEPPPGAGTDPTNLRTRAVRDGGGWVIDGHKWFASGGGEAAFLIVMARTSEDPRTGATMFVVDRGAPGVTHVRDVPTMGLSILDLRAAELRLEGVRVGDDAVLGAVGEGFRLAQVRLVPARLTHCMRWLGLAARTLDMCRAYVATRTSFGKILARHQLVQEKLADGARDVHAGNLMTFHAAWLLHEGRAKEARPYASMAKLHVARTLCRVLDDAIQLHGASGYSDDLPFGAWYRSARAARIGDGADEVHQIVVARDFLLGRLELLV